MTTYRIHFGRKATFVVNEWLYNYFNSVKDKPTAYNRLYKILTSVSYEPTIKKK